MTFDPRARKFNFQYVQSNNYTCNVQIHCPIIILDECLTLVASSANLPVVYIHEAGQVKGYPQTPDIREQCPCTEINK